MKKEIESLEKKMLENNEKDVDEKYVCSGCGSENIQLGILCYSTGIIKNKCLDCGHEGSEFVLTKK